MLFTAWNTQLDTLTARLYWRALHDVPAPLLDAAITIALRERVYPTPPRPADMRKYAEQARQALVQQHPWKSCGACSWDGWIETESSGYRRMTKCDCTIRHQQQLKQLGAAGPVLQRALPAGRGDDGEE